MNQREKELASAARAVVDARYRDLGGEGGIVSRQVIALLEYCAHLERRIEDIEATAAIAGGR